MPVELTDAQDALLNELRGKLEAAEEPHRVLRRKWDRLDRLYHSYTDFRNTVQDSSRRDKDGVLRDGQREFGTELFIPYSFAVVETVLPRLLSNRPRMLVTPRDQASERNVDNVRFILDAQQGRANYELTLQDGVKSGLIYGLGIQQVAWRRDIREGPVLKKSLVNNEQNQTVEAWVQGTGQRVMWDDPYAWAISIYDFLWDPFGDSMDTVGHVFSRSWRSTEYVMAKIESGAWCSENVGWQGPAPTREDVDGHSGKSQFTETWSGRKMTQGASADLRGSIHEILEYRTGNRVVTLFDRAWPVADVPNPAWHGRMGFQAYRPTKILGELPGKGAIEPMEDLQYETNSLRTDRRWNALLKLHQSFFYEEGTLDPAEVKLYPGSMSPVNGPPRELLMPVIPGGDIPGSAYREDADLRSDIERVTGISDPVSGVGDAAQTATGVQLVQAAANIRIQLQTRRAELELAKAAAQDWTELNQQHIIEQRDVRGPMLPQPGQPANAWSWKKLGPAEIAGDFEYEVDGGSTAPENVPQKRQDAQIGLGLLQLPGIDRAKLLPWILENLGIKAPETMLAPEPHVPPATLDMLMQFMTAPKDQGGAGLEQDAAHEAISQALQAALQAEQQGQDGGGQPPGEPPTPPPAR